MTRIRILALAAAALGSFLAIVAGTTLSSGEGGVFVFLGVLLAAGAAILLVLAVVLFRRRPTSNAPVEPVRRGPLQRISLLIIGAAALTWSGSAIVTGKFDSAGSSRDVLRSTHPSEFWQIVSVFVLAGGACIYLGMRRSPADGNDRRQGRTRSG